MRAAIVAVILLVVVFFAVPLVSEGTTNSCQALEKHNVSNTASSIAGSNTGIVHNVINSVGQAGATGQVASSQEAAQNPNTPSPVSCTVDYWKSVI